ncbi:hypothetical protein SNEBB_007072 [Seison nebaliae]|nr:hypothetical protein SNEBB_007072 [Seison nebaliae]
MSTNMKIMEKSKATLKNGYVKKDYLSENKFHNFDTFTRPGQYMDYLSVFNKQLRRYKLNHKTNRPKILPRMALRYQIGVQEKASDELWKSFGYDHIPSIFQEVIKLTRIPCPNYEEDKEKLNPLFWNIYQRNIQLNPLIVLSCFPEMFNMSDIQADDRPIFRFITKFNAYDGINMFIHVINSLACRDFLERGKEALSKLRVLDEHPEQIELDF